MSLKSRVERMELHFWRSEHESFIKWRDEAPEEEVDQFFAGVISGLIDQGLAPPLQKPYLDLSDEEQDKYWTSIDPEASNEATATAWISRLREG